MAEPVSGKEPHGRERLFELLIHDLSGPLSVIAASTASLLRRTDGNGRLTEREHSSLERILRNARRSQVILQEMIEVLRSEAGSFRKESFLVEDILKESILEVLEIDSRVSVDELAREPNLKAFWSRLEPHGIFIGISGKYGSAAFSHDPRKIQQIVRNLVSNALKHRRQRIDVSISGDADLLVSVEDDGPGISETDQGSVFQRFARLQADERRSVAGLGLGLAGVKALVEAMGGTVTFVSREGTGARFSVGIPPLE